MDDFRNVLSTTTAFVLEDWGMMLVDPAENEVGIFDSEEILHVVVAHFHGCIDGELSVICQQPFLEALAQNLLGLSSGESIESAQLIDALKELANVLSGNFLTAAYGDDVVFDLVTFDVEEKTVGQVQDLYKEKKRVVSYLSDDEPVSVAFTINTKL